MSDEKLLTHDEVTAMLRVSSSTLSRMRKANTGPAYVKIGRRILYKQNSVLEYLNSNTIGEAA